MRAICVVLGGGGCRGAAGRCVNLFANLLTTGLSHHHPDVAHTVHFSDQRGRHQRDQHPPALRGLFPSHRLPPRSPFQCLDPLVQQSSFLPSPAHESAVYPAYTSCPCLRSASAPSRLVLNCCLIVCIARLYPSVSFALVAGVFKRRICPFFPLRKKKT